MKAKMKSNISAEITMILTESEARALEALASYDIDQFLKVVYLQMGKSYLKPYESGLRSLFIDIGEIRIHLTKIDKARGAFNNE